MTEEEKQKLRSQILVELLKRWPDHNPKIAGITEYSFTYELEKHRNYTYYVVKYELLSSGEMKLKTAPSVLPPLFKTSCRRELRYDRQTNTVLLSHSTL